MLRLIDVDLDQYPRFKRSATIALILLLMVFVFFPTFWMLSNSFKPNEDAFRVPPHWVPAQPTLHSYESQINDRAGFRNYFRNGMVVSLTTALVSIIVSMPAGYAFARLRFRGKRALLLLILASQMFPAVIIVITLYSLYRRVHLLDTYQGLVLAFTSFSIPFSVWMLRGFCESVPEEIEEAAFVDGCSRVGLLWRIVIPLIRPGLLAVGLFSFLNAWNNLLFALSLTTRLNMRTIPPGFLLTYVGEFQYMWSDMFAASVLVTLPTVILFIGLQRFLVRGLMAGAVKG